MRWWQNILYWTKGKSGFIWYTTGSGKTMTSYKATCNLLMDISSIDIAIAQNYYDLLKKIKNNEDSLIINENMHKALSDFPKFAGKWYFDVDDVKYEAYNYRDGELANANKRKDSANYAAYREEVPDALPKFKFRKEMIDEFKEVLMPEIGPLID